MEFNKSNRFNNENQKEEKSNLMHYAGKAGEFDYDCTIWEISCNHLRFRNRKVESLPKNLELPGTIIEVIVPVFKSAVTS